MDRLETVMDRGPVSVVSGPGGIGKTALVLSTLHAKRPKDVPAALFFAIKPDEPLDQLRLDIVTVLNQAAAKPMELPNPPTPDAVLDALIELAERDDRVVVLDDLHHVGRTEADEFLVELRSWARTSRWVATMRVTPRPRELSTSVLELSGLDAKALSVLGKELAPDQAAHRLESAARAAKGSPWLFMQHVLAPEDDSGGNKARILGDLTSDQAAFLRSLSVVQVPLARPIIETFSKLPDDGSLATMEQRGLLRTSGDALSVHDVVRQVLGINDRSRRSTRTIHERVADALAGAEDADAILEACRIYLALGQQERVVAMLLTAESHLLKQGRAPRLWQLLEQLVDPALLSVRLRCATLLGNPTVLERIQEPDNPGPGDKLAWAKTLFLRGELGLAAQHAAETDSFGGSLLAARSALLVTSEDIRERLSALQTDDDNERAQRDALIGYSDALRGHASASETIHHWMRQRPILEAALHEAALDVAAALLTLGRATAADELIERVLHEAEENYERLATSRRALVLRGRARLESGELSEVAAIVSTLTPFVRAPSLLLPFVLELDAARRFEVGLMDGFEEVASRALRAARRVDSECTHRIEALLFRAGFDAATNPSAVSGAATANRVERDLSARIFALRRGEEGPESPAWTARHAVLSDLANATSALMNGEPRLALDHAKAAAARAKTGTERPLRALAQSVCLDALACTGADSERAQLVQDLQAVADWMGSDRYRLEAELHLSLDTPSELERIAAAEGSAPSAARRAQALLGGRPDLDAYDHLVVKALSESSVATVPLRNPEHVDSAPWQWESGWGVDCRNQTAWLSDGRMIELARRPLLWKLLFTLVESGGGASKEHLVLTAWGEPEYHPARHDSRLHVSIRKIRELLEEDPSTPRRLVTTEVGYALGGAFRYTRA